MLENTTSRFDSTRQVNKKYLLFTVFSKQDRRFFVRFLRAKQFTTPNIKIKLTCFPKIVNFQNYNTCLTDETFSSEVRELIRKLNVDGYYVVAEVFLTT